MTGRLLVAMLTLVLAAAGGSLPLSLVAGLTEDTSKLAGQVTVVVFLSARCPVSNAYGSRLEAIYSEYSKKGVRFLFVNSNSNETSEEIARNAKQHGFTFPIYEDSKSAAAIRFGAELTPETYLLNKAGTVQYHGAVDDAQNPARVKNQNLRLAIDAVLAGTAVPTKETKAFGCTIKKPRT